MRRAVAILRWSLATCAIAACSRAPQPAASSADTLTRRQRDSVLGASRIPGARGIQRAMRAADTTSAQTARTDSIQ